jgi:superfamily II helicase
MIVIAQKERVCNVCGRSQPIEQFRLRSTGSSYRHSECNDCHNELERTRGLRRSQRDLDQHVKKLLQKQSDLEQVASVVRAMVTKFGGLDRMSELWIESIKGASAKGRHGIALRGLAAIERLMVAAEQMQMQAAALVGLLDEDYDQYGADAELAD